MTEVADQDFLTTTGVGRWALDASASTVRVAHKTMWGMVTVKGEFKDVAGEGEIAAGGLVTGSLSISATSLDTGNKKRDEHLRSADFFDAEHHPTITLTVVSAAAQPTGVAVQADLEVKGVHHPLPFTATITEATADSVTATAEAAVDRKNHQLTWNQLGMMKDVTTVSVTAVFRRAS
jgi:polyisoprenoid-binding protein YceI